VTKPLVAEISFLARLKDNSFGLRRFKSVSVSLTYLFSVEETLQRRKLGLFRYVLSICENNIQDIEIASIDSY